MSPAARSRRGTGRSPRSARQRRRVRQPGARRALARWLRRAMGRLANRLLLGDLERRPRVAAQPRPRRLAVPVSFRRSAKYRARLATSRRRQSCNLSPSESTVAARATHDQPATKATQKSRKKASSVGGGTRPYVPPELPPPGLSADERLVASIDAAIDRHLDQTGIELERLAGSETVRFGRNKKALVYVYADEAIQIHGGRRIPGDFLADGGHWNELRSLLLEVQGAVEEPALAADFPRSLASFPLSLPPELTAIALRRPTARTARRLRTNERRSRRSRKRPTHHAVSHGRSLVVALRARRLPSGQWGRPPNIRALLSSAIIDTCRLGRLARNMPEMQLASMVSIWPLDGHGYSLTSEESQAASCFATRGRCRRRSSGYGAPPGYFRSERTSPDRGSSLVRL